MRSFSIRGMSTKGFYGPNAKSLGSPTGYGQGNSSGGNGPTTSMDLFIFSDHIDTTGNGQGLLLSELMTPAQQTLYQSGNITTLNIIGSGSPSRGYWIVAGFGGSTSGLLSSPGQPAFVFDLESLSDITVNLDTSILHFYGGGGAGGSSDTNVFGGGAVGGDAIVLSSGLGIFALDLNITNTVGAHTGKIFAGGGGGGAGAGDGGQAQAPCGGGGGASGWNSGTGGTATGGSIGNGPGSNGGVYDSHNGGTNDPNVAGGAAGVVVTPGAGDGGGLGADGGAGSGSGGAAGLAVNRSGGLGATSVLSGGGASNIRGTVQ